MHWSVEVKDLRNLDPWLTAKVDSKVDNIKEDVEEIKQEVEKVNSPTGTVVDKLIGGSIGRFGIRYRSWF